VADTAVKVVNYEDNVSTLGGHLVVSRRGYSDRLQPQDPPRSPYGCPLNWKAEWDLKPCRESSKSRKNRPKVVAKGLTTGFTRSVVTAAHGTRSRAEQRSL
jgi:hypothetical protein